MVFFDETVRLKLLSFFFRKSENEAYVKEIATKVKVSTGSVSVICRKLAGQGILRKVRKGNVIFYSLNNDDFLVRKLKSVWFLEKLSAFRKILENKEFQSVALYGSYSSGDFISKSDIDILVLTNVEKDKVFQAFSKLECGPELSLTVLTLFQWQEMARKNDRFYLEVISNHTLLYGSLLVIG